MAPIFHATRYKRKGWNYFSEETPWERQSPDWHHEHDPARHRGAEYRPHQHALGKLGRHPGARPLRRGAGQSPLRRQGTQGGAAKLPHPHRRDRLSLSPALHQDHAAGGRGGVVINNTFLSNTDNASVSLRQLLLESCNLHTALDCPGGTFLGAGVKTVVLFFEKGAATRKIWYYQLDPGRNLGKTNPLNDDDLAEFVKLQATYADSPKSWSVDAGKLDKQNFDLSVKNPNGGEEVTHRSPEAIMDEIAKLDAESAAVLANIRGLL